MNVCGWMQEKTTDNFDWIRYNGATSSRRTGPSTDHTSGNGYYMYIETSSPRRPGDIARLISPTFDSSSQQCMTFYYHMYGTEVKALNVYFRSHTAYSPIAWTRQGTQGNRWFLGQVQIPTNRAITNIVFEGVRGTSILGDIAIDDVMLNSGNCTQAGFNCNFDTNICGWWQDKTIDNFDWIRYNESTYSSGTGPSADPTTGNGYYMYIETSAPRNSGDKARLISPIFDSSSQQCMTFYYHMYRTDVKALNVYFLSNTVYSTIAWTRRGTQDNRWFMGQVQIPTNQAITNIVFEGVHGTNVLGDIAIDDVMLNGGNCIQESIQSQSQGLSGPVILAVVLVILLVVVIVAAVVFVVHKRLTKSKKKSIVRGTHHRHRQTQRRDETNIDCSELDINRKNESDKHVETITANVCDSNTEALRNRSMPTTVQHIETTATNESDSSVEAQRERSMSTASNESIDMKPFSAVKHAYCDERNFKAVEEYCDMRNAQAEINIQYDKKNLHEVAATHHDTPKVHGVATTQSSLPIVQKMDTKHDDIQNESEPANQDPINKILSENY